MKGNRQQLWRLAVHGYLTTLSLDPMEIAALPALVLLQSAIVVVWLAGRAAEGEGTTDALAEYVELALTLRDWVNANGTLLVAEALRANG
jgi:Ser/Thr protein kinase RdoA (MazF antagonist)